MSPVPRAPGGRDVDRDPAVWRFRIAYAVAVVAVFVIVVVLARPLYLLPAVDTLNLYCFSALEDAVRHGVLPAFRARYEEETGRRVELITTFAGSGLVTRQIVRAFPVDVAILSSPVDALYAAGHGVPSRVGALPHGGVVTTSPLVLVVREGNPLAIRDWQDLARDDVEVVHPDPTTSGAGVWSILIQYSAVTRRADDPAAGAEHLARMRDRVVRWPDSSVSARAVFDAGIGDVLITYGHQAGGDPALRGEPIQPEPTILTEHVVIRGLREGASPRQREVVDAFVTFLWSAEARAIFAEHGLRSPPVDGGPGTIEPAGDARLVTLATLGGAATARREILERVWYGEIRPAGRR